MKCHQWLLSKWRLGRRAQFRLRWLSPSTLVCNLCALCVITVDSVASMQCTQPCSLRSEALSLELCGGHRCGCSCMCFCT